MRLLLLHNPAAGPEHPPATALVRTLEDAGHVVVYRSTSEADWLESLTGEIDVVVVAGGDGTVRSTAVALATGASKPVPLAILPQGTANNIARSVGSGGTVTDLAQALETARHSRLAIGRVRGPWGERHFLESAGVGFFASFLSTRPLEEDRGSREDRMQAALERLRRLLAEAPLRSLHVRADGEDLPGDYLMVEALNIPAIGPGAPLAPEADHAELNMRLVLVGEGERSDLEASLGELAEGALVTGRLDSRPVHRLELDWPDGHGHVDDEVWPLAGTQSSTPPTAPPARVLIEVAGWIPLLLPVEGKLMEPVATEGGAR